MIAHVILDGATASARALSDLSTEFPMVGVERGPVARPSLAIEGSAWRSDDFDFGSLGVAIGARPGAPLTLTLRDEHDPGRLALQVLTRHQRFVTRRNAASTGEAFEALLDLHRALHDRTKPLVAADYDHALDTWQWVLRLEPAASRAVQVAAVFHEVERLLSDADERREQHAKDYDAFKLAHARAAAALVGDALGWAGLSAPEVSRVVALIRGHERADDDELALLNDADALSFFSLSSAGFLRYYGLDHTEKKVRCALARLRPRARARLAGLRLRREISVLLAGALLAEVNA